MEFGIYVHHAGSTWFDQVVRTLTSVVQPELLNGAAAEVDGLYFGFFASGQLADGQKKLKKRVRRDYTLKDAVGSRHFFQCLVEFDAQVADSDLVAHSASEGDLFEFAKTILLRCLPEALSEFEHDQKIVHAAVLSAELPHQPRW